MSSQVIGQVKTHWSVCVDCGTQTGPISGQRKTPDRISGARFGIQGSLCRRCYHKYSERERRANHSEGKF